MSELDKLVALFDSLPADDRKAFTAHVKDYVSKTQGFTKSRLIDSKENDGIVCPHCQQIKVVKYGVRRGVQWYRCKSCGKTFSSVSNTFLSWTKKDFSVWKKYLTCMINGLSLRKAAEKCGITKDTAFVWRHKILDALAQYAESQRRMKGIVEMDDTFFRVSYKGSRPKGRRPHRRGTPSSKRGLSKEQVCVSCIVSRDTKVVYSKVSALGMSKAEDLKRAFEGRISKKAIICSDKARAFQVYARRRKIEHIQLQSGTASKIDVYHIQNVNGYHSRLKQFIRLFKGVSTKYLNNYLVWMNVIQESISNRVTLLKLCIKATMSTRWHDVAVRPSIPIE